MDSQVLELEDKDNEWAIDKFAAHHGIGKDTLLEAAWKSGDHTWVPYASVAHLDALKAYLEAQGIETIGDLPQGTGVLPDDPQIFGGSLSLGLIEVLEGEFPIKRSEGTSHHWSSLQEPDPSQHCLLPRLSTTLSLPTLPLSSFLSRLLTTPHFS